MKLVINSVLTLCAVASLVVSGWIIKEKFVTYNNIRVASYKVGYMHGYYDNTPPELKKIVCGQFWKYYHDKAIDKLNQRVVQDKMGEFDIVLDFDLNYRSE